jgi:hypothetical protein
MDLEKNVLLPMESSLPETSLPLVWLVPIAYFRINATFRSA